MRARCYGPANPLSQLLSQIFVASKVSVVKIKLLAKQVLTQARGAAADQAKVAKLLGDGNLDTHEVKGVVAALHFILVSAARYDVAEEVLSEELQQLGLPKEHAEALASAFKDGRAPVQQHLRQTSLRLPALDALRWRVHEDVNVGRAHAVEMLLDVTPQQKPAGGDAGGGGDAAGGAAASRALSFRVDAETLGLLCAELKAARERLVEAGVASDAV